MIDAETLCQIDRDGFVDVDCIYVDEDGNRISDGCGETSRVEPDGDYDCTNEECHGRFVSPLILEGLI
jgi:hypothetical protein